MSSETKKIKRDINKRYREDISIETIFIIFIPKTSL